MRKKSKTRLFFLSLIILMLLGMMLINIDAKILPAALASAELRARSDITEIIFNSVRDAIESMNLVTTDFYKKNGDTIIIDTLLINNFCNNVAAGVSQELNAMQNQKIFIPLGILTGIKTFSNFGTNFAVVLNPTGGVTVNYDSSFSSAGINQIHFQIWLNVESTIRIVSPLQAKQVDVSGKIPLVNTVIIGEVPKVYMESQANTTPGM